MKPINRLLKTLKEIKEGGRISDYWIPDIKNAIIDYINEESDRDLEELEYTMVSEEQVMDCVKYKAEQGDFWGVSEIMEGLKRADRYKDNGDYFDNIDDEDVEDRLDEIIERAEQIKKSK